MKSHVEYVVVLVIRSIILVNCRIPQAKLVYWMSVCSNMAKFSEIEANREASMHPTTNQLFKQTKWSNYYKLPTSNELRCNWDTSRSSSVSDKPTKLSFVIIVIELPAKDNDRKFFNNCISTGTFVRSLSDRSRTLNEDMLWANSWETVGSSFSATRRTRSSGNGKSGISVSDTLLRPNFIRLPWSPTNALSITLSSLLFDKSKSDKRGSEANAASSILRSWLLERSKQDSVYEENVSWKTIKKRTVISVPETCLTNPTYECLISNYATDPICKCSVRPNWKMTRPEFLRVNYVRDPIYERKTPKVSYIIYTWRTHQWKKEENTVDILEWGVVKFICEGYVTNVFRLTACFPLN